MSVCVCEEMSGVELEDAISAMAAGIRRSWNSRSWTNARRRLPLMSMDTSPGGV